MLFTLRIPLFPPVPCMLATNTISDASKWLQTLHESSIFRESIR